MGAAAAGWTSAPWGQSLPAVVLLGRVAGTIVIYRRLRADVPLRRAWTVGILAAAIAMVLELTLTH
jgi:hypothetical protein